MHNSDFNIIIELPKDPVFVFLAITKISDWWTKDFAGRSSAPGDEFTICHPGQHYSRHRVTEMVPGEKISWLTTESEMSWLRHNKTEWTNTNILFELLPKDDHSLLHFTHKGLTPDKECYEPCCRGWREVILERLKRYVTQKIKVS
jgi:hypothetical protein